MLCNHVEQYKYFVCTYGSPISHIMIPYFLVESSFTIRQYHLCPSSSICLLTEERARSSVAQGGSQATSKQLGRADDDTEGNYYEVQQPTTRIQYFINSIIFQVFAYSSWFGAFHYVFDKYKFSVPYEIDVVLK